MIDILTSEDMENMSLHVFQYLTLYYIININIVWLYTMHENVSLNIDIKYFGKKTSIWWQLCANQIETLTSPPGHTWGICLFSIWRRREFDLFF